MNAIQYAANEIRFAIDNEILEVIFPKDPYDRRASVMERLTEKVIRGRVLLNLDIISSREITVDISKLGFETTPDAKRIYNIPYTYTQQSRIISVGETIMLPLTRNSTAMGGMGANGLPGSVCGADNALGTALMKQMIESTAGVAGTGTASAELIGNNVVAISGMGFAGTIYGLVCNIANDPDLKNIPERSYGDIAELCTLAVKSYINIHGKRLLAKSQFRLGVTAEYLQTVVDEYSEAEADYKLMLKEVIQKVLFMSDRAQYREFIRAQIKAW